jgi:hypothetical protein
VITDCDVRLGINGLFLLTVYDDNHAPDEPRWEHNAVAARWTPNTGWIYPP